MTEVEKLIDALSEIRHSLVEDFRFTDATTIQLAIDLIDEKCND